MALNSSNDMSSLQLLQIVRLMIGSTLTLSACTAPVAMDTGDIQGINTGCPDNVEVVYQYTDGVVSTRTYHGAVQPGLCRDSRVMTKTNGETVDLHEAKSAVGIFSNNKIIDLPKMGWNMLYVLQGKAPSATYMGMNKNSTISVTFTLVEKNSSEFSGQAVNRYNFVSTDSRGFMLHNFDVLYMDNPMDHDAPIFLGTISKPGGVNYATNVITATSVKFLSRKSDKSIPKSD